MAGVVITWRPHGIVNMADIAQREMQGALEKMGDELSTPKGKGLGVQVNSLSFEVTSGLATVESSLIWPRTTGESWLARSAAEAEGIADQALQAAGEAIVQGVGD